MSSQRPGSRSTPASAGHDAARDSAAANQRPPRGRFQFSIRLVLFTVLVTALVMKGSRSYVDGLRQGDAIRDFRQNLAAVLAESEDTAAPEAIENVTVPDDGREQVLVQTARDLLLQMAAMESTQGAVSRMGLAPSSEHDFAALLDRMMRRPFAVEAEIDAAVAGLSRRRSGFKSSYAAFCDAWNQTGALTRAGARPVVEPLLNAAQESLDRNEDQLKKMSQWSEDVAQLGQVPLPERPHQAVVDNLLTEPVSVKVDRISLSEAGKVPWWRTRGRRPGMRATVNDLVVPEELMKGKAVKVKVRIGSRVFLVTRHEADRIVAIGDRYGFDVEKVSVTDDSSRHNIHWRWGYWRPLESQ